MNWQSILAGLAQGASGLGQRIQQRDLLKEQQQRQAARDAMADLVANAQLRHVDAQTMALLNPRIPPVRDPVADATEIHRRNREADAAIPLATSPKTPTRVQGQNGYIEIGEDGQPKFTAYPTGFKPNEPAGPQPTIIQAATPDGQPRVFRVPKEGGPAQEVEGIVPKPTNSGAAAIQTKVAGNRSLAKQIRDAINDVKAHPLSFGFRRRLGDDANQRLDPGGVSPRAKVANIGSLKIHDRTGANMTIGEQPRLQPFIPDIRDQSDAIVTKLTEMLKALEDETAELERTGGVASPGGGRGGGPGVPQTPSFEQWKSSRGTP